MSETPLDILEDKVGETVIVRLKDGERLGGVLEGCDQHMNLVLGPKKSVSRDDFSYTLIEDTTVIRGDNIVSINL